MERTPPRVCTADARVRRSTPTRCCASSATAPTTSPAFTAREWSEPCQPILVERRGAVGLVTLNRPEKLNALNSELVDPVRERAASSWTPTRPSARSCITGAGDRAFSAGGDMAEQLAALATARTSPRVIGSRRSCTACTDADDRRDSRLLFRRRRAAGDRTATSASAATDARIKFHGASYGRAPGGAVLPRIVGDAKAKELLFTGDEVDGAEALRIGLLNQVVPRPRRCVDDGRRHGRTHRRPTRPSPCERSRRSSIWPCRSTRRSSRSGTSTTTWAAHPTAPRASAPPPNASSVCARTRQRDAASWPHGHSR